MTTDTVKSDFTEYVLSEHAADLLKILEDPDDEAHFSIIINFMTLFDSKTKLGDDILSRPIYVLPMCDEALISAQELILAERNLSLTAKVNVHARITSLPECPELHKSSFPRNEDLGWFLSVSGTVVSRSVPQIIHFKRFYSCSKCKYRSVVTADYEKQYVLPEAGSCANPVKCSGTNLTPITNSDSCKDYQEIKLQEQVTKLDMGSMPKSMLVTVEDDLIDACKPGDDVIICGTVRRQWKPLVKGEQTEVDLVLQANYIKVCNNRFSVGTLSQETIDEFKAFWQRNTNRPLHARDEIVMSISPDVYGLYVVKLATAIVMAGGVGHDPGSGARVRGESHLLLVGDPGIAKSHILKFITHLAARSVFTTGIGSTTAGLTVSASMGAGGQWQLEAGALVLADGGVCCIDEFNSMPESQRASIHEAMEQQTISIAKAGIVCELQTKCTILAATNPIGKYDPSHSATVNCGIASPLLSRFDLVFILLDTQDPDWDRLISSHVLLDKMSKPTSSRIWTTEKLQAYFCVIKNLNPKLTEKASKILTEYYKKLRETEFDTPSTIRLLESLIRLSQGHARLMFRDEVTVLDAVFSVYLMEASYYGRSCSEYMNAIQSSFPADPMQDYMEQAQRILGGLGLESILEDEMDELNKLKRSAVCETSFEHEEQSIPKTQQNNMNPKLQTILNNMRQTKIRLDNDACAVQGRSDKRKTRGKGGPPKKTKIEKSPDSSSVENNECPREIEKKPVKSSTLKKLEAFRRRESEVKPVRSQNVSFFSSDEQDLSSDIEF